MAAFNPADFSSDSSQALKQFKDKYGRSPMDAEISAYRSRSSSPSARAPAAGSASPAGASNIQSGFGGQTQWDTIKSNALAPTTLGGTDGFGIASTTDIDMLASDFGRHTAGVESSIDKLSAANEAMLKGEIPADVSASVRRAASENSIMRGVGGQAARSLSARDLGLTSMDIRERGIATETKVAELRGTLATTVQGFRDTLVTRNLQIRELENQARELNLKGIDVERQRIATNISANVNILGYMTDLIKTQQMLSMEAAGSDIDPSGMMDSIDRWLAQFGGKLSG